MTAKAKGAALRAWARLGNAAAEALVNNRRYVKIFLIMLFAILPAGASRALSPISGEMCGNTYYKSCNSGYTLVSGSCIECTGCTDCTSDTTWSEFIVGTQRKVDRYCNCNTCVSTSVYRCAAGYFGFGSNNPIGCISCPNGGTSLDGSVSVSECFSLPSGDDEGGYWDYLQTCYYQRL